MKNEVNVRRILAMALTLVMLFTGVPMPAGFAPRTNAADISAAEVMAETTAEPSTEVPTAPETAHIDIATADDLLAVFADVRAGKYQGQLPALNLNADVDCSTLVLGNGDTFAADGILDVKINLGRYSMKKVPKQIFANAKGEYFPNSFEISRQSGTNAHIEILEDAGVIDQRIEVAGNLKISDGDIFHSGEKGTCTPDLISNGNGGILQIGADEKYIDDWFHNPEKMTYDMHLSRKVEIMSVIRCTHKVISGTPCNLIIDNLKDSLALICYPDGVIPAGTQVTINADPSVMNPTVYSAPSGDLYVYVDQNSSTTRTGMLTATANSELTFYAAEDLFESGIDNGTTIPGQVTATWDLSQMDRTVSYILRDMGANGMIPAVTFVQDALKGKEKESPAVDNVIVTGNLGDYAPEVSKYNFQLDRGSLVQIFNDTKPSESYVHITADNGGLWVPMESCTVTDGIGSQTEVTPENGEYTVKWPSVRTVMQQTFYQSGSEIKFTPVRKVPLETGTYTTLYGFYSGPLSALPDGNAVERQNRVYCEIQPNGERIIKVPESAFVIRGNASPATNAINYQQASVELSPLPKDPQKTPCDFRMPFVLSAKQSIVDANVSGIYEIYKIKDDSSNPTELLSQKTPAISEGGGSEIIELVNMSQEVIDFPEGGKKAVPAENYGQEVYFKFSYNINPAPKILSAKAVLPDGSEIVLNKTEPRMKTTAEQIPWISQMPRSIDVTAEDGKSENIVSYGIQTDGTAQAVWHLKNTASPLHFSFTNPKLQEGLNHVVLMVKDTWNTENEIPENQYSAEFNIDTQFPRVLYRDSANLNAKPADGATSHDGRVYFEVSDSGSGIKSVVLEQKENGSWKNVTSKLKTQQENAVYYIDPSGKTETYRLTATDFVDHDFITGEITINAYATAELQFGNSQFKVDYMQTINPVITLTNGGNQEIIIEDIRIAESQNPSKFKLTSQYPTRIQPGKSENLVLTLPEKLDAGTYASTVEIMYMLANAGEYDNYMKIATVDISATVNPIPGSATVTILDLYYGESIKPVVKSATNDTQNVTFLYKNADAVGAEFVKDVPKETGNYYVKAILPATGNYLETTAVSETPFAITRLQPSKEMYQISLPDGNQGWYITPAQIKASAGNGIAEDEQGTFSTMLTVSKSGSFHFVIRTATGAVTAPVTLNNLQIDLTAPATGENEGIYIGNTWWNQYQNVKAFDTYDNWNRNGKIQCHDNESGIKDISYCIVDTPMTFDQLSYYKQWTAGTEFKVSGGTNYIVYAKLQNQAGLVSYVSTAGMVTGYQPQARGPEIRYRDSQNQDVLLTDQPTIHRGIVFFAVKDVGGGVKSVTLEQQVGGQWQEANEKLKFHEGYSAYCIEPGPQTEVYRISAADLRDKAFRSGAITVEAYTNDDLNLQVTDNTADYQQEINPILHITNCGNWNIRIEDVQIIQDGQPPKFELNSQYRRDIAPKNSGEFRFWVAAGIDAGIHTATVEIKYFVDGDEYNHYLKTARVKIDANVKMIFGTAAVEAGNIYYGENIQPVVRSTTNDTTNVRYLYKDANDPNAKFVKEIPTAVGSYFVEAILQPTGNYLETVVISDKPFIISRLKPAEEMVRIPRPDGKHGWYVSDVKITAEEGYLIAANEQGPFRKELTADQYGDYRFVIKTSSGAITAPVVMKNLKIDKTEPSFDENEGIYIGNNWWNRYRNVTKFDTYDSWDWEGKIRCHDDESGIAKVSYCISDSPVTLDQLKTVTKWIEGTEFNVSGKSNYVVYAKLENQAGLISYISTAGMIHGMKIQRITGGQPLNLESGIPYQLPDGNWHVAGDTTIYTGGITFYVAQAGEYTFIKEN